MYIVILISVIILSIWNLFIRNIKNIEKKLINYQLAVVFNRISLNEHILPIYRNIHTYVLEIIIIHMYKHENQIIYQYFKRNLVLDKSIIIFALRNKSSLQSNCLCRTPK